jgi:hypothetical protein
MRTLAIIGTAGGVGVSTLAALARSVTRSDPRGPSRLLARDGTVLPVHGAGDDLAANGPNGAIRDGAHSAIWDAGAQTPSAAVDLLQTAGVTLVLVAPSTPLGSADARCLLDHVVSVDDTLLPRVALVQNGVYGRHRGGWARNITPSIILHWPYDRALARSGGEPHDPATLSRRSRHALSAFHRYCTSVLRCAPARPPVSGDWTPR